jgi:hypothetical protein
MAAQAEIIVPGDEHLWIHGAVRIMAGGAALEHRVVFEDERTGLLRVALGAGLVGGREIERPTLDRIALVRVVAVAARNFSREHRMRVRETHLTAFIQVTLETRFRRLAGIDDGAAGAAALDVDAGRAVACFAPGVAGLAVVQCQPRVGGATEMRGLVFMTLHALLRPHECGARDLRRRDHGSIDRYAGDQQQAPHRGAAKEESRLESKEAVNHGEKFLVGRVAKGGCPDSSRMSMSE